MGEYLILGGGELKSGGHRRASILADAVEALIGAIYLESGMDECKSRVLDWFDSRLASITLGNTDKDAKTRLQEYLQERHMALPEYAVVETQGEAHAAEFVVECRLEKLEKTTRASASNKKKAEKQAAQLMLAKLAGC